MNINDYSKWQDFYWLFHEQREKDWAQYGFDETTHCIGQTTPKLPPSDLNVHVKTKMNDWAHYYEEIPQNFQNLLSFYFLAAMESSLE